jgi:hypothetical protein
VEAGTRAQVSHRKRRLRFFVGSLNMGVLCYPLLDAESMRGFPSSPPCRAESVQFTGFGRVALGPASRGPFGVMGFGSSVPFAKSPRNQGGAVRLS